ncbi:MAG: hypothetical protein WD342_17785 [Verrucomicrobiales bacterium]
MLDFCDAMPRIAARRAVVRIHPALDAGVYLDEAGGKVRNAVSPLTADMESRIQAGIDAINAENDAPGAALLA